MALICTCGTELPDNARFCHHCGRPQRPQDLVVAAAEAATPLPAEESRERPPIPTVGFGNPAAVRVAMFCGSLCAVLNALPIVSYGCCLWLIGAGFLAVFLYGRRTGLMVTAPQGAWLGGMTGLLGFVLTMVLTAVNLAVAGGESGGLREIMRQSMSRVPAQDEYARQVMEFLTSPAGLALAVAFYLVMGFVAMVLLATAGGALGAKVLEKD